MRNIVLIVATVALLLPNFVWAEDAARVVPQNREAITLSFAPLVKRITPAVVNIYTKKVVRQRLSPLFSDPFFRQFFGDGLPDGYSRERLENSLGSGVIVRSDGLVVTSNHVIDGADEIRIVLSDRREFDAKLVTADQRSDLAVLKIDAKGQSFAALELGNSDAVEIGDLVLAIGNPFGVGQTVTSGIISAVAQRALRKSDLDYYLQTDAAINPGNSGGALVTMDGKLIGINAAIYSRDGGNLGIGFAVPSNMVRVAINAGEAGKNTITRPWLGFDGQEVTPTLAASLGLGQPRGVLVGSIKPQSTAVKAGLQTGDVITAIDGHSVDTPEAFRYRIATAQVGGVVSLDVVRKGRGVKITLPLIAAPESVQRDKTRISGRGPLQGAEIQNLSPAVAEELGVTDIESGVIVTDVDEASMATNIGLQVGDIIAAINGMKMATVADVLSATKANVRGWRVTVQRGDNVLTIMVGG